MRTSGLVSVLLLYAATGVSGFSVTSSNTNVEVRENDGADLTCSYSADFSSNARVEWKFKNEKGSQAYVLYDGKPTSTYAGRVSLYSGSNLRFSKVTRQDNGEYDCEVSSSSNSQFGEVKVYLTVLVAPQTPVCRIPSSGTTGRTVRLTCHDAVGSPRPTYRWFKDGRPLPEDPSKIAAFKNLTYTLDAKLGTLVFSDVKRVDSGRYHCEAINKAGPAQSCKAIQMQINDPNVGGIVAGVIVALLLIGLLIFGIWYAYKKGYIPQKTESKPRPSVVYQPPSTYSGGDDDETDFKQKSSFVV